MLAVIAEAVPAANERDFMRKVYSDYERLMYFIAWKCVSDQDACEEVVQDTVLNLIPKAPLLEALEEKARAAYISAAVRNTAYSFLRKQAREQKLFLSWSENLEELPSQEASLDESMALQEEKRAFLKIWNTLEAEDRFILEGRYILQYTDRELAESLGCQPSSVRMKLTRTRRKVGAQIKTQLEEGDDKQ